MHPSIRNAYETSTHPLAKHPVHGVYGKELAHDQYENIKGQYTQSTGSERLNQMEMMQLLRRIMQREAAHKEQLEQIAKRLVASVWKIDPAQFEADLGSQGQSVEEHEAEKEEDDNSPLTPDEQKQVHKRVTLNTMSHGAAIHQMTTLHHMVKEALDKIDPALMPAYDKLARGSVYSSWFMSIEQIVNMAGQKGGDVHVEWPEQAQQPEAMPGEEPEQPQEEAGPVVKATGLVFPILVHELAKGCMELLTMHGLPQDEQTLKKVYKHADKWEDEVFHFFVGPALWRRFLKVVDRTKLPESIAALSRLEPDDLHGVVRSIVENPAEAQERLAELVRDPEGYDPTEDVKKIAKMLGEADQLGLDDVDTFTKEPGLYDKHLRTKMPLDADDEIMQILNNMGDEDIPGEVPPVDPMAGPAPAPATPTKPAPAPVTPSTPRPSTPNPYRPVKPSVVPKRKACDM